MVVALHSSRRGHFLARQSADTPPARGLETTSDLDQAQRFADQAAIDAHVTALGGVTAEWLAMTLP